MQSTIQSENGVGAVENGGDVAAENYQQILNRINHYNGVGFTLLLAKDVGILDALINAQKPMTSQELADNRNIKERYTREILATLVVVEAVKVSVTKSGDRFYFLDEAAKKVLNNGINIPDISLPLTFMARYNNLKDILPINGPRGIDYCQEFVQFEEELNIIREDKAINFILENIPEIRIGLEKGMQMLEFGSGAGSLVGTLAQRYKKSVFTATEINKEYVRDLKKTLGHLPNVIVATYDVCNCLDQPMGTYDWIIIKNVTHTVPFLKKSFKGMRKMTSEPNGFLTVLDFFGKGDPLKSIGDTGEAMSYARSVFCCLPLSLQQENSEGHGCCWSQETGMSLVRDAGYEVSSFFFPPCQALIVGKPI